MTHSKGKKEIIYLYIPGIYYIQIFLKPTETVLVILAFNESSGANGRLRHEWVRHEEKLSYLERDQSTQGSPSGNAFAESDCLVRI